MVERKYKILCMMGCYRPGNDATGPTQSLRAMMLTLKDFAQFYVIGTQTRAERQADTDTYSHWIDDGICLTKRLPVKFSTTRGLKQSLDREEFDCAFLAGFFDREVTIPALLMLGGQSAPPIILSPRGEFAHSALSHGRSKKQLYLKLTKLSGLTRNIWFHSTADHETADIERTKLPKHGILQAANIAKYFPLPERVSPITSDPALKLAFLGRVSPVKNLPYALNVLSQLTMPIDYDIYGPIVDTQHWQECETLISKLPNHIRVRSMGAIANTEVPKTIAEYDAMFLPSQGENFGHAIHESLMSGIPVIISDQTPWRDLARHKAGWDLSLSTPKGFVDCIEALTEFKAGQRQNWRSAARNFAEKALESSNAVKDTISMFKTAIEADNVET